MGNTCTKELSLSAFINKAVNGNGHASKYRNTEMGTMSRLNSPELSLVKESQVKYAILHPQIKDILLRLSYSEIQILLNVFRLTVRWIRSNPSHSSTTSVDGVAAASPKTSESNDGYAWKRLSLSKHGLFDLFPSLHLPALQRSWSALMTDFHFPANAATFTITAHLPQILSQENVLKMFLFSDYKNGISNASTDLPQEIIFQDFATIAAILLHGSKEELYTLLFLLFSEEITIPVSNTPTSSSFLMRGLSRRQSSENNPNKSGKVPGTMEADHGMVVDSKSHSMDGSILPSSTQSHDSPDKEPPSIVPPDADSQPKKTPHDTTEESQQKKLVLTDRRLIELFIFMLCMLYHDESTSQRQRQAMRRNQEFMKLIVQFKDLLIHHSVEVDRILALPTFASLSTQLSADHSHISLSSFLRSILSPDRGGSGHGSSSSWNKLQLLSSCNVSQVLVSSIFQPIFYDLIPNPFEIVKIVLDLFSASPSVLSLRASLAAFQKQVQRGASNDPHLNQERAELLDRPHGIFLLEYEWWREFCDCMDLQAEYSEVAPGLVVDLQVKDGSSSTSLTAISFSKYELFDIFLSSEEGGEPSSSFASLITEAMTLSLMNNRSLLREVSPETFEYLPSDLLSLRLVSTEGSNLGKQFIMLPYEVGKALYEYYDLSAATLSPRVFRRSLRYLSNTASPDYISHLAQQDQKESLSSAVRHFVNNFQIPLTIFYDIYDYYSLPIYLTTPLGLATLEPLDSLNYYSSSFLSETSSVRDFLEGVVRSYGLSSVGEVRREDGRIENNYRLWALRRVSSAVPTSYAERSVRLPFNTQFEWVLVTEHSTDYRRDCQGFLWNLYIIGSAKRKALNGNHAETSYCKDLALALMVENRNEENLWPSDTLLSAQLSRNVMILTDTDPRSNGVDPESNDQKVLKVGLSVDFLCDDQKWRPAIISHVHKIDTLTDLSSSRRSIVLTVKYFTGSSQSETLAGGKGASPRSHTNGSQLREASETESSQVSEIPFESSRLLVNGSVTELLALHCLPSLQCEEFLRTSSLKSLKRHPAFLDILQQSSPASVAVSSDLIAKPSSSAASSSSVGLTVTATQGPGSLNEVVLTPNGKSTARNSSVVPITVAFTPEPLSPRPTMTGDDNSPVHGHHSHLEARFRDQIDGLTVEDLDCMDLNIVELLAKTEDLMKAYFALRLSDEYWTMYLRSRKELVAYRIGRSKSSEPSVKNLFYHPNSNNLGDAKGNLIEVLDAQADDNKAPNRSSGTYGKSPGKQLLSKWDRLFPSSAGTGNERDERNSNTQSSLQKPVSQQNLKNGKSNNNSMENIPPYSMSDVIPSAGPQKKSDNGSLNHSNHGSNINSAHTSLNKHGLSPLLNPTVAVPATSHPSLTVQRSPFDLSRRMGIIGLNNLGNTCFLSSALQCLLRTPIFVPYFLSYQYKFDINDRSKFGTGGKVTEEFAEFVRTVYNPHLKTPGSKYDSSSNAGRGNKSSSQQFYNYFGRKDSGGTGQMSSNHGSSQSGNGNQAMKTNPIPPSNFARVAISPITFYKLFQKHKTQFTGADQQDAQEFLSELLDTFHEDLKNDLSTDRDKPEELRNMIYNNYSRRSLMRLSLDQTSFRERSLSAELIVQSEGATAGEGSREKEDKSQNRQKKLARGITAAVRDIIVDGHKTWDEYTRGNDSIITNVFQGQLCTHVFCVSCGQSSTRFEPFTTLSLPIPKAVINPASSSVQGLYGNNGELCSVVIKFYRKLPRWSVYWRLRQFLLSQLAGQVSPEEVDGYLRRSALKRVLKERKATKRFVLKCSKNMTIEMVKTKAVEFIRSHWGGKQKRKRNSYSKKSFQQVFAGDPSSREGDNNEGLRQSSVKNGGLEVENVEEEAPLEPQTQQNDVFGDSLHYDLKLSNLTMIDVSSEEKFRIRKIVENKEYLASVIDENSSAVNECELLLVENNKDIAMISSLPASKLNINPDSFSRHHLLQLNQSLSSPVTKEVFSSPSSSLSPEATSKKGEIDGLLQNLLFGYLEEEEYYENNLYHRLLLHTSPPLANSRPDNSPSTVSEYVPEKLICDVDYCYSSSGAATPHSQSSASQSKQRSSSIVKPFPRSIHECRLLDRVDALDHKDQWYSGTVVEILSFPGGTETVMKKGPSSSSIPSQHRKRDGNENGSGAKSSKSLHRQNNGDSSVTITIPDEVFVRVHFDNYSHLWDEWYDATEFQQGCVVPIFTRTNRKLKIYDIQIIQRKLLYAANSPVDGKETAVDLAKIELVEEPFILQVESYRSISHLYSQVVEQMARYLPSGFVEKLLLESPLTDNAKAPPSFETLRFPFEVRMVNIQNLFAPPVNPSCYSSISASSGHDRSKERFERHKQWEGMNLPKFDRDRPVSNIYHPKLILAIDWEYLHFPDSPSPSEASSLMMLSDYLSSGVRDTASSDQAQAVSLLPDTRFDDDESVIEYDKLHRSNLPPNAQTSALTIGAATGQASSSTAVHYPWTVDQNFRQRNSDRKVYHLNSSATSTASPSPTSPSGRNHNNSGSPSTSTSKQLHDPRPGLTIEEVLSNFTAKEEIDYFCERCKEMKKGMMYASIHKAPDVLILHLKRLIMNSTGGAKIRTLVKFPLQNLDISQFMTQNMALKSSALVASTDAHQDRDEDSLADLSVDDLENCYDLFGVVNHLGGMYGGHYTAYAQCEDLLLAASTAASITPSPSATFHTVQTCSELRSILFDHSEVSIQDYSLSPATIHPVTSLPSIMPALPSPPTPQSSTASVKTSHALSAVHTLESTYRWYKFDDDYAIELTAQHSSIEPTIVSESAYLLFYKKKQLSPESILRYT